MFQDFLHNASRLSPKDTLVSTFGKIFANHFAFHDFGQMTQFSIDSTAKTFHVQLDLKGEAVPIEIDGKYRIENAAGKTFLIIESASTSREWMTQAVNRVLTPEQRRVELPEKAATMANLLNL